MSDFFPVFFDLKQQTCLVVGGGKEALRKTRLLLAADAVPVVVADVIAPELEAMVASSGGMVAHRSFAESDLLGKRLVIVATEDEPLRLKVSGLCMQAGIPVNVVDQPELCSFIVPTMVDRSPLVIAIGSGGESPVLARQARIKIEQLLPQAYGDLAGFASRWRSQVKEAFADLDERRRFWEWALDGPVADAVLSRDVHTADECMQKALTDPGNTLNAGSFCWIRLEANDPDLLTVQALRYIQSAEFIVHDLSVTPTIINLARRDADRLKISASDELAAWLSSQLPRDKKIVYLQHPAISQLPAVITSELAGLNLPVVSLSAG